MASGPDIFIEGRQTLNAWLLSSGAPCVWELKVELGAIIRDVLQHPSSWDLSLEAGISLPPLSAFYGGTLHSLAILLSQPPSWDGLRELGILLEKKVAQDTGHLSALQNSGDSVRDIQWEMETAYRDMAHLDSLWMLLMDFPAWIQFAAFCLFQRPAGPRECYGNGLSIGFGHLNDQPDTDGCQEHAVWLSHQEMAARYIAWHFSPHDQKLRGLVMQMLRQTVKDWLDIKAEESHLGVEFPAVKRRKLTTSSSKSSNPSCDEQKAVVEEFSTVEGVHRDARRKITSDYTNSLMGATMAVQKWLLSFQDCCSLLDSYSQEQTSQIAATENKQQAKRRLALSDVADDVATKHGSQQPGALPPQYKRSAFFDCLPLVVLACSPLVHNDAVVHLILHSVMVGSEFLSSKKDGYQEGRKGITCKEPSHRTEDFRDACQAPFCLNFAHSASSFSVSGISRVFKFLEILDLLEFSSFVNGCHCSQWLDSFKETMVRQLQMCIRSWSQHADNTFSLTVLDDLQHRASLWAARTRLESKTLKAFTQVLQDLDILIASSVVDDTL